MSAMSDCLLPVGLGSALPKSENLVVYSRPTDWSHIRRRSKTSKVLDLSVQVLISAG